MIPRSKVAEGAVINGPAGNTLKVATRISLLTNEMGKKKRVRKTPGFQVWVSSRLEVLCTKQGKRVGRGNSGVGFGIC